MSKLDPYIIWHIPTQGFVVDEEGADKDIKEAKYFLSSGEARTWALEKGIENFVVLRKIVQP